MKHVSEDADFENVQEILPLSPTQEGMLFEVLQDVHAVGRYNSLQRVVLEGPLEPDVFREVFAEIALAPDVSRAAFVYEGITQPVQVVKKALDLPFSFENWDGEKEIDENLLALENRLLSEPFDLAKAPLMSVYLIKTAHMRHVLLWRIHHMISDAWSIRITLEDALGRLNGRPSKPAGPAFREHLSRLRLRNRDADRAFFKDYFSGFKQPTCLAPAHAPGRQKFQRCTRVVSEDTTCRLTALARDARVTQATALFTAWGLCLRRLAGQSDVVFGRVTAGRDPTVPHIERAVGPYLTVIPTRLQIEADKGFRDLLQAAEDNLNRLRAYDTAALPDALDAFEIDDVRVPFDTLVSIQGIESANPEGPLQQISVDSYDATGFPFALILRPGPEIEVEAVYDETRFARQTAEEILEAYTNLIDAAVTAPETSIRKLNGLPLSTISPLKVGQPVHLDILAQADQRPQDIAIVCDGTEISYGQLRDRALALASRLKEANIQHGDVVPVAAERHPDTVVAMLGVLCAGAAYTPIDPSYPDARNRMIFETLKPRLVITNGPLTGWDGPTLAPNEKHTTPNDFSPVKVADTDPAYLIFTSGTTGKPKGVVISHGNLAWSTAARCPVYGGSPKAFLHLSSFAFDSSVVGLYWTLTHGGKLIIAPDRSEQNISALMRLAAEQKISHMLCLPGLWSAALDARAVPDGLDTVIVAGEAVPPTLPQQHRDLVPGVRLFNEYGPTEGTVWSAARDITDETGSIPIGHAPPGAGLDVCDADGWRMPIGMRGELVLRGQGVAQGYFGEKGPIGGFKGAAAPAYWTGDEGQMQPNGALICHGRLDAQLKIRGHRIELEEIEAAAMATGAKAASAAAHEGKIILGVTGAEPDIETNIAAHLPSVMRPTVVHHLGELPRLPNGKADRNAIAALGVGSSQNGGTHEGFYETKLANIWQDVLDQPIGPETHFFQAGGDSLMTVRVFAAAEAEGMALRPGDIFDFPILKDLAAELRSRQDAPLAVEQGQQISLVNPGGTLAPVLMFHGSSKFNAGVAAAFGPDRPCMFNWSHHLTGPLSLRDRIETFSDEAIEALTRQWPDGPINVGGFSLGAVVALDVANKLQAMGRPVNHLLMVDPSFDVAAVDGAQEAIGTFAKRWSRAGWAALRATARDLRGVDDKVARTRLIYQAILAPYKPTPYAGPCLVLQNELPTNESNAMIAATTPNAQRQEMPYQHLQLLDDRDAIADVAARLAAALNKAEREARS